tara:strand:+ start:698 stop:1378 length:681 start_codon:yes stop_codon:yes gene_type:complete
MEWTIKFNFIKKLNDELQIAVAEQTKIGDKISKDSFDEQPHFEKLEYHTSNPKVFKRLNLYDLIKGKIKLNWEWVEEDKITQNDIDFITNVYKESHREEDVGVYEHEDNSMSITVDKVNTGVWTKPSMEWELKTSKSSMEIIEDDTKIFCALSDDYGWKIKTLDLPRDTTIETLKLGDKCYLWFDKGCEINGIARTGTNIIKKLNSGNCMIKNTNNETLHLVMVYK